MKIVKTAITCVKEKLKAPFGFKGGFLSELWQVAVKVETDRTYGIGVGVQSVLWSDASVFPRTRNKAETNICIRFRKKQPICLSAEKGKRPLS